jgi:transcriptional regulator with GAF, ATPase, and Fis domain
LPELEAFSERLASCGDLDSLLDTGLNALSTIFGIDHSFVMALDEDGTRLYTLASHGYAESGEGREFLRFPGSGGNRIGIRRLTDASGLVPTR